MHLFAQNFDLIDRHWPACAQKLRATALPERLEQVQRALGHLSPIEALESWRVKKPELFLKRVYKQAELDTYLTTPRSS